MITPLLNPSTPAEQLFNESQIRTRNPIERCFGVLKRRFPILSNTIRLNIDKVEAVVVACAVLHNICIELKDELTLVDEEEEAAEEQILAEPIENQLDNTVRSSIIN